MCRVDFRHATLRTMCALCGVTQAPVCTATGACGINLQQLVTLSLILGGSFLTLSRLWIVDRYYRALALARRISTYEKI